jgi:hypothetical protein
LLVHEHRLPERIGHLRLQASRLACLLRLESGWLSGLVELHWRGSHLTGEAGNGVLRN